MVTIAILLGCFFIMWIFVGAADKKQELWQIDVTVLKGTLRNTVKDCRQNMKTSQTWGLNPNYEAVALQRDVWAAIDETSMQLQRLDVGEYKKELEKLQEQAQANVSHLDEVEKEMREEVIDCDIVAGEYKSSVETVFLAVESLMIALQRNWAPIDESSLRLHRLDEDEFKKELGKLQGQINVIVSDKGLEKPQEQAQVDDSHLDEIEKEIGEYVGKISEKERNSIQKQLDELLSLSNMEVSNQSKSAATDAHYLKYSELLGKQKDAISTVKGVLSRINGLREKIAALLGRIDR
jgi:hypothetical protein